MSLTSLRSVRAARQLSRALATSASPAQSAALSSASASSWNPPIAPGVEPAYDEALAVIAHDRADKRRQIQQLKEGAQAQDADIQKRIESLEVAADINDPQVRWAFENGKGEYSTGSGHSKQSLMGSSSTPLCSRYVTARFPTPSRAGMAQARRIGQACESSDLGLLPLVRHV